MNSHIRKLPAIGLVLVLLATILTATQEPVRVKIYSDYGMITEAPRPSILMRTFAPVLTNGVLPNGVLPNRVLPVRELRRSPLLFRRAGGIMLDAVGQPCGQLATKRLSLSYDVRRAKDKRLVLLVDNRAYSAVGVDDRDLRAIAEFSEDEDPVLVNATIPQLRENEETCRTPTGLRFVNVHRVFANTRLGWLLTRMDTIPWSFSEGKRWATQEPLPASTLVLSKQLRDALVADADEYTKLQYATIRRLIAAGPPALERMSKATKDDLKQRVDSISSAVWEEYEKGILNKAAIDQAAFDRLSKIDRRMLLLAGLDTGTERVSNINDHESAPNFCAGNSTLVFDGTPRLEFFRAWYDSPHRFESSSDLMSGNFSQLRLIDQEAYDAAMEIYDLSGLFKYVKKQQSPVLWQRFIKSLPPKGRGDDIEIACPQCTRDQVTTWLACLASAN